MNVLLLYSCAEQSQQAAQALLLARGYAETGRVQAVLGCAEGSWLEAEARKQGLEHLQAFGRGLRGMLIRRRLKNMLKSGAWLLHSHDSGSAVLAASLLPRHRVVPFVHTRHMPVEDEVRRAYAAYNRATSVICATQETAYAMAQARVSHQLLRVLPDAIDPAPFPPRPPRNATGRLVLLCPGTLEMGNGQETVLRALAPLHEAHTLDAWGTWELRLCGSGSRLLPIVELAAELGIQDRLIVLDETNFPAMLQDADILITGGEGPTGCNRFIYAAWSAGVPILCSDRMAHKEFARDGENALIYAENNPETLSTKLAALAANPSQREALSRCGREAVKQYVYSAVSTRYINAYKDMGVPL